MLNYFNKNIKPFNDNLTDLLNVKKITIKDYSFPEAVTVQILTSEGDLDECNHAGATEQEYMNERYSYSMEDVLQDIFNLLTCDKNNCKAIYHEWDQSWSTN